MKSHCSKMSTLYVYVPNDQARSLVEDSLRIRRNTDSGFDIPLVNAVAKSVSGQLATCIDQGVHVAAVNDDGICQPCLLIPRSSLSKTNYRLANSIGLIDAGYRGEVKAMVDVLEHTKTHISDGTRLFQIVSHNFLPWKDIQIVSSLEELPAAPDTRGSGGFGSTGQ